MSRLNTTLRTRHQELKAFLDDEYQYWQDKQQEAAKKFAELNTKGINGDAEPKRNKRKKGNFQKSSSTSFAYYAAELHVEFYVKVSTDWRDIALTLREKVFTKDDAEKIDIHDIKVRKQATSCKCQYKFSSAVQINNFSLFVSEHVREYYYNL